MCPACIGTAASVAASVAAVGGALSVPSRWWTRLLTRLRTLFSSHSGEQQ
jgi:hypothetical protein